MRSVQSRSTFFFFFFLTESENGLDSGFNNHELGAEVY